MNFLKLWKRCRTECLIYIVPYMTAMVLVIGITYSTLRSLKDKYLNFPAVILCFGATLISFDVIVLPALFYKIPELPLYLKALIVFYSLLASAVIGLSIAALIVFHSIPFHPQIQEIVKRIHSGEIGNPKRINATFSFDYGNGPHLERRFKNGDGALPDLDCYLIDFVSLISRCSPVTRVQKTENQTPFSFGVILYLANGMIAELRSSIISPSINTWEVICERG